MSGHSLVLPDSCEGWESGSARLCRWFSTGLPAGRAARRAGAKTQEVN